MKALEYYQGSLLGLAIGDALGTSLEFSEPGNFTPITDMIGGGPFELAPGQWTDDTSMALCLAESLITCQDFNLTDQLDRYLKWYKEGYLSSKDHCFDIGNTTRLALLNYQKTKNPYSGSTHPRSAGNGSLMRLCPVALFYSQSPDEAIEKAGESSKTTHGATTAIDACRYFAGLLVGILQGQSKEQILTAGYHPSQGIWQEEALHYEIDQIAQGSFKTLNPPYIRGSGYVVKSLEAALWAFYHSHNFRHGCLMAVNLGEDADTTGAIYGQIAGAYYGLQEIPEEWLDKIYHKDLLMQYAEQLYLIKK